MAFIVKDMRRKNITVKGGDRTQIIDGSRPILSPIVFSRASQGYTEREQGISSLAAVDEPRYAWLNGRRGFLIESAATNLAIWSADLTNAAWEKSNVTAVSPTQLNVSSGGSICRQIIAVTPGVTYTWSMSAKRGTLAAANALVYNMTAGSILMASTSYYSQINSSTFTTVKFSFTAPAGCTSVAIYPTIDPGVTGTINIEWQQVEVGAVVTSRIVTTSYAVTRAADVPTISTTAFGFNPNEGTFVAEYVPYGNDGRVLSTDPVISKYMALSVTSAQENGWYAAGLTSAPGSNIGVVNRGALAYSNTGYFAVSKNASVASESSVSDYTTKPDFVNIGTRSRVTPIVIFSIVYCSRKFTAAELQAAMT